MSGQLANSFGPVTSASAVTTTGGKNWVKPRGLLSSWGYVITTAGSTSTVTVTHKLQGTLSESTAPATADIYTVSTGSGTGYVAATGKPARQVRISIDSLTSTSTGGTPTATAVIGGTL